MTADGIVIAAALVLLAVALVVDWLVAVVLTREAIEPPAVATLTAQALGRLSVALATTFVAVVAIHGTMVLWGLPAIGIPEGTRLLPVPWPTVLLYIAAILPSAPSAYYVLKLREWRQRANGNPPRRRRDDA